MGLALSNSVSFCLVGGKPIFLDRKRDRYFGLPESLEEQFMTLLEMPAPTTIPGLDPLVRQGLLVPSKDGGVPQPCRSLPPPAMTLLDATRKPRAGQLALAAASIARTKASLAIRPWHLTLDRIASRVSQFETRKGDYAKLTPIAAAFDHLNLWLSPLDKCLPRSMAFMARCLAAGQAPSLVIGVKLQPFGAHCWVQYGATLANERIEKARAFTPIWIL